MDWEIKSLHQIELSSQCNLRCVYCPSPTLQREKVHIEHAAFVHALEWVKHFVTQGTQGELNLAGIGESTLHPRFVEYVGMAREAAGPRGVVCFATNGLLMTRELAAQLAPFKPTVWVSLHRPEKAKGAIDALREFGLLAEVSVDPSLSAVDWAGQVDWRLTTDCFGSACDWRHKGWVMVMADGRLTTCCFDQDGSGVIGSVWMAPGSVRGKPYKLCKTCHHDVGVEGFRDRIEGKVMRGKNG